MSMEEQKWDDYESNFDPINSAPDHEPLPSLYNDRYIYTYNILIHKYKEDIQRMNELRNQSVFLFTVMGFLLSSALGIFFSRGLILGLLVGGSLILIEIYLKIIVKERLMCEYPGSEFLDKCKNPSQDVFIDLHAECNELSHIIRNNSKRNEELPKDLIISTCILCFIIFLMMAFWAWEVEADLSWILLMSILPIVLFNIRYLKCLFKKSAV